MYAERKELPLQSVGVERNYEWMQKEDSQENKTKKIMQDRIQSRICLKGNLTEAERKRLAEIANRCFVRTTLSSNIDGQSYLVWP